MDGDGGQGHGAAATLPVSIDLLYCSASFYISESYNSKIKNKTYYIIWVIKATI